MRTHVQTGQAKGTKAACRGTGTGRQIIGGLKELRDAIKSGEPLSQRFTVRTVELPDEPSDYTPAKLRETREKIGASQAVFACLIGASEPLVKAWERGARLPSPMARRLLDEVNRDPARWSAMLKRGSNCP